MSDFEKQYHHGMDLAKQAVAKDLPQTGRIMILSYLFKVCAGDILLRLGEATTTFVTMSGFISAFYKPAESSRATEPKNFAEALRAFADEVEALAEQTESADISAIVTDMINNVNKGKN
jgi:hypothetical protein